MAPISARSGASVLRPTEVDDTPDERARNRGSASGAVHIWHPTAAPYAVIVAMQRSIGRPGRNP